MQGEILVDGRGRARASDGAAVAASGSSEAEPAAVQVAALEMGSRAVCVAKECEWIPAR